MKRKEFLIHLERSLNRLEELDASPLVGEDVKAFGAVLQGFFNMCVEGIQESEEETE